MMEGRAGEGDLGEGRGSERARHGEVGGRRRGDVGLSKRVGMVGKRGREGGRAKAEGTERLSEIGM